MDKKKATWFDKVRHKYRLVIMNDDTLEEYYSFRLSRMNLYVFFSTILVFMFIAVFSLIFYTPLKEYIPGYGDTNLRRDLVELTYTTDSLETVILKQNKFIANIKDILADSLDLAAVAPDVAANANGDASQLGQRKENLDKLGDVSESEEALRKEIEQSDNYELFGEEPTTAVKEISDIYFFSPVKGTIIDRFNPDKEHFGVDVLAPLNEPIKAVLDGTVILDSWTLETGHVLAVQHENNLVSFYKHNSVLLKKVGSFVKAGDAIAILGNTGEKSTGPHLHFELWLNQTPVDPLDYVNFDR